MLENDIYAAALIAIIAWILLIYIVVARPSRSVSASRRYRFYRAPFRFERGQARDPDFWAVAQQLDAVMAAPFAKKRLLGYSEYQVFRIIEHYILESCRGYRVFAQTSLGEVLQSPNENAFRSINSKRVDILIVDQGGWPVLAIEYQGNGHYKGTAAARDAIKREALRKAGVGYFEISPGDSAEQIRSHLREKIGGKTPMQITDETPGAD